MNNISVISLDLAHADVQCYQVAGMDKCNYDLIPSPCSFNALVQADSSKREITMQGYITFPTFSDADLSGPNELLPFTGFSPGAYSGAFSQNFTAVNDTVLNDLAAGLLNMDVYYLNGYSKRVAVTANIAPITCPSPPPTTLCYQTGVLTANPSGSGTIQVNINADYGRNTITTYIAFTQVTGVGSDAYIGNQLQNYFLDVSPMNPGVLDALKSGNAIFYANLQNGDSLHGPLLSTSC